MTSPDENKKHIKGVGQPQDGETEVAQKLTVKPRRAPIASVTDLGLSLVKVHLTSILCIVEQAEQLSLPPADLRHEGKLLPNSLSPNGFRTEVSWFLDIPGIEKKPISIAGKHVVQFSTSRLATKRDAEFYSQINAIILLYPYLRQLVDDLSAKSLGQSIIVSTLDVLGFVKKETARFYEQQESQAVEGE